MDIYCDLSRLKAGGGLQVGQGFLSTLGTSKHVWRVLGSPPLLRSISSLPNVTLSAPSNLEKVFSNDKAPVHYQLFGPGRLAPTASTVTGCAYSNLFYPEIDFWAAASGRQRLRAQAQDHVRRQLLKRQDHLVFETEAMRARCHDQWKIGEDRLHVVKPSIGLQFAGDPSDESAVLPMTDRQWTLAAISGVHPNKRIANMISTMAVLEREHAGAFRLIITADDDATSSELVSQTRKLGLEDAVSFVGRIPQSEIGRLYGEIDGVLLFSVLESFSNNVIECLASATPLFATDADWARSQAGEAGVYVDPSDAEATADRVWSFYSSPSDISAYAGAAGAQAATFPSLEQRRGSIEAILEMATSS